MGKVSLDIGDAHDEQVTFVKYDQFYRDLLDGRL
jgi:hypothetical protein